MPCFGRHGGLLAGVMLDHPRELLTRVGYGNAECPFVEFGIGLDYGEAYVGNVGEARGGEILLSGRLASELDEPLGESVEVSVKGKAQRVVAHRLTADLALPMT